MRTHDLKCWPEPFQAILDGRKRYEIRVDDRAYMIGDELILHEWDPSPLVLGVHSSRGFTERHTKVRVTYLTPGGSWGLPKELCVMSIEVIQ